VVSTVEAEPEYLRHSRAHLIAGIGQLAGVSEPANDGPIFETNESPIACAVAEGVDDADAAAPN
jgi:hypothetical protein